MASHDLSKPLGRRGEPLTTTPSTKPKPFCFVLMPFAKNFSDIYEFGIKGACNDTGLYCERVDEQVFLGSMLERIYSQISRSDILIADMTGKNPNVFYKVGYAHALGKNVTILTSVAEDIPFDLKHFPHIVYGSEIKQLRTSLIRHLTHLTSLDPKAPLTQVGLELFLKNQRLASGGVVLEYQPGELSRNNRTFPIQGTSKNKLFRVLLQT